jgi:preprotein translocase SecF subunit
MYIKGKEHIFNFIGRDRYSGLVWWGFIASAVALIAALLAFTFLGLNLGIEFKGGYLLKVQLDEPTTVPDINDMLDKYKDLGLNEHIVQVSQDGKTLTIRMPIIEDETARAAIIQGVRNDLISRYQDAPEVASFEQNESGQWVLKVYMKSLTPASYVEGLIPNYQDQGLVSATVNTGSEKVEGEDKNYVTVTMNLAEGADPQQVQQAVLQDLESSPYNIVTLSEEQVGAEWGKQVSRKAIISLAVFLGVILIYISFRFEFKMAVPAIGALVHDTVITVGIYALTGRQVTPATVIAFLTIMGYSLYDTIVVFDRIAENANLMDRTGRRTYREMVNESINQTLMRSIGTTLTTLLPIFTILIFGGDTLKDFAFALFIGVFLGSYSSIFVAPPFLAFWKETEPKYASIKAKADKASARETVVRKKGAKPAPVDKVEPVRDEGEREAAPRKKPAAAKAAPKPTDAAQAMKTTPKKKPAAKPGAKKTTKGPSSSSKKKKKKKK